LGRFSARAWNATLRLSNRLLRSTPIAALLVSGPAPAAPALLVEDDGEVGRGQMRRSEFMPRCGRRRVVPWTAPWPAQAARRAAHIDYWFGYYEDRTASQIERALRRYAPAPHGDERERLHWRVTASSAGCRHTPAPGGGWPSDDLQAQRPWERSCRHLAACSSRPDPEGRDRRIPSRCASGSVRGSRCPARCAPAWSRRSSHVRRRVMPMPWRTAVRSAQRSRVRLTARRVRCGRVPSGTTTGDTVIAPNGARASADESPSAGEDRESSLEGRGSVRPPGAPRFSGVFPARRAGFDG
jgi:hypothetical protein